MNTFIFITIERAPSAMCRGRRGAGRVPALVFFVMPNINVKTNNAARCREAAGRVPGGCRQLFCVVLPEIKNNTNTQGVARLPGVVAGRLPALVLCCYAKTW